MIHSKVSTHGVDDRDDEGEGIAADCNQGCSDASDAVILVFGSAINSFATKLEQSWLSPCEERSLSFASKVSCPSAKR